MNNTSYRNRLATVVMIAGVYGYFLLFSQFAFLEWVQSAVQVEWRIKTVLGAMALTGVLGAFVARKFSNVRFFRMACICCAVAAVASVHAHQMLSLTIVSALMGLSLGVATVSLAALLPRWLEEPYACLWVGIGTGLGYALCNVPTLFLATPSAQAYFAAVMMLLTLVASLSLTETPSSQITTAHTSMALPLSLALPVFFALVWFDSGAFYVIQHVPELKKATWGAENLWRNAGLHFFAAVAAGFLLSRGSFRAVILTATILLAIAAMWVNHASTRQAAGWLYPIAVSFYSTALVCWPGLLDRHADAWKRAAWVFAIAGWIGSAMGIGMVEKLHIMPLWFVLTASGLIIACLYAKRLRSFFGFALLIALATTMIIVEKNSTREEHVDAIHRGKQVFIAEGCIHCHSQYVRPGSRDEMYWGKASDPKEVLQGAPVMIGNRRQGPDLTHISGRRSDAWLREHFLDPRLLAPHSSMPRYTHLFEDQRGSDLIAFLTRDRDRALRMTQEHWQNVVIVSDGSADVTLGKKLFAAHCRACHGDEGRGDGPLARKLTRPVTNLVQGPFLWTQGSTTRDAVLIAKVIRYGIPGTDMPGHETWDDHSVRSLRDYVMQLYAPASR